MNLILKTRFGSHLYGTDTPNSDLDYKGVFIAPIREVLLNKASKTIYQNTKVAKGEGIRNTKDDTDFEMIELRKYLKDAIDGQTYALHLLFTPLEFTEYYNNIWAYIWLNRNKLISRNMEPYIGYCRHQAAKYGLKGSRLGEMIRLVEFLKTRNPDDTLKMVMNDFTTSEFIKLIPHQVRYNKEWKTEDWWYILGKLFAQNSAVKYVIHSCEYFMNTYGERARLAQQNEGIDWKAISHAYRCMFQLEEIADTGTLIFPLRSAEKLKAIKLGQVSYSVCQDELPQIIDRVTQKIAISPHVADKPDIKFWDDFIVSTYLTQVHENPRNI